LRGGQRADGRDGGRGLGRVDRCFRHFGEDMETCAKAKSRCVWSVEEAKCRQRGGLTGAGHRGGRRPGRYCQKYAGDDEKKCSKTGGLCLWKSGRCKRTPLKDKCTGLHSDQDSCEADVECAWSGRKCLKAGVDKDPCFRNFGTNKAMCEEQDWLCAMVVDSAIDDGLARCRVETRTEPAGRRRRRRDD